jgi:hypothetical protein
MIMKPPAHVHWESCSFYKSHVNVRLWHQGAGGPKTNEGSFSRETARVIASLRRPDGLARPSLRRIAMRGQPREGPLAARREK